MLRWSSSLTSTHNGKFPVQETIYNVGIIQEPLEKSMNCKILVEKRNQRQKKHEILSDSLANQSNTETDLKQLFMTAACCWLRK